MRNRPGSWIERWRLAVLLGAAAVVLVGALWGRNVVQQLSPGGFAVSGGEHEVTAAQLETSFDERAPDVVVAYRHPEWSADDPRFVAALELAAERIRAVPGVVQVRVPEGERSPLRARDGSAVLVPIALAGDDRERVANYDAVVAAVHEGELEGELGGRLPTWVTAQKLARSDLIRAELIAIPVLFVLFAWFFRSLGAAVLPLLVTAVSILGAMTALRVLTSITEISLLALNVVTFLGFGLAVDYSLFMIRRFREELAEGAEVGVALARTRATAGRTVAYSGIAVAASLLGLSWFDIGLLRSIALGGTVVTLVTLGGALLVLPAMLAVLGRRIDALALPRARRDSLRPDQSAWFRIAGVVMTRPLLVATLVSAVLLTLALPARRIRLEAGDSRLFPTTTEVRRVWDLMGDEQRFGHGELMPIEVLVEAEGSILAADNVGALFDYARTIETLPGIVRVDSLVTSGERRDRASYQLLAGALASLPDDVQTKIAGVARGSLARMRIVSDHPPSSTEAREQLAAIRALAPPELTVQLAGRAQIAAEIEHDLAARAPPAILSIAAVTFAVLFFAFGSVVLPFKAMVMNALSVAASYGVLVWIFQDGRFETVLGYESSGAIDPTILAVTFAVMFGLSMDYEVFLLSRIREEYAHGRDNARAVAIGLGASGRVITGAAAILLAVVVGFVAGEMVFIKELGVGMAVAVIVDASIVRALLLPAAMALLGRYNWWSPPRWRRWWKSSGLGVDERSTRAHAHG